MNPIHCNYAEPGDLLYAFDPARPGGCRKIGEITGSHFGDGRSDVYIGDAVYDLRDADDEILIVVVPDPPQGVKDAIGTHVMSLLPVRVAEHRIRLFSAANGQLVSCRIETVEMARLTFDTREGGWFESKPHHYESYTTSGAGDEDIELGIDINDSDVVERPC